MKYVPVDCNSRLNPVTGKQPREGDMLWMLEIYTYPKGYTAEAHDLGHYDIIADVDEQYAYASNMLAAVEIAKGLERRLGFEREPGRLQNGVRYARYWFTNGRWEFDADMDWQGG
jgi:hypothetical protein